MKNQPVSQFFEFLHVSGHADEAKISFPGNLIALLVLRLLPHPYHNGLELVRALQFQVHPEDKVHVPSPPGPSTK